MDTFSLDAIYVHIQIILTGSTADKQVHRYAQQPAEGNLKALKRRRKENLYQVHYYVNVRFGAFH